MVKLGDLQIGTYWVIKSLKVPSVYFVQILGTPTQDTKYWLSCPVKWIYQNDTEYWREPMVAGFNVTDFSTWEPLAAWQFDCLWELAVEGPNWGLANLT